MVATERIGFHFDVMCPWAYQTSVWIRDVRRQTGLMIDWRFFSLEEINRTEGKKHPWERDWSYGWGMMRVAALLRRTSMDDCDRFYEAAGRALHVEGRKPHRREVAAARGNAGAAKYSHELQGITCCVAATHFENHHRPRQTHRANPYAGSLARVDAPVSSHHR